MKTVTFRTLRILPSLMICLAASLTGASVSLRAASADLWQARNGTPTSPKSPVQWAKGNAGPSNSHYVEGNSIPYRVVMSDLTNGPHRLIIEWDTIHKGKHAIDYITHYDRLAPHSQFGAHVSTEVIDPLDDIAGAFGLPGQFPIPSPATAGSSLPGQPAASFQTLPAAERLMTIWNATISSITYVSEESLAKESAATRVAIEFVSTNKTVVIAWGGHIASSQDWGSGNSAVSIWGSPYHTRKIELDGAGGNQDRSLQALAVATPPTLAIAGAATVCAAATNTYTLSTDAKDPTSFQWSLANNTAGAVIVGATNGPNVEVAAGSAGTYSLEATVFVGNTKGTSTYGVTVTPATSISPLPSQTVCPGSEVIFSVVPSGTAPFTFTWSKDGQLIPDATNSSLTLGNITAAGGGLYCATVIGTCGSASSCATLAVEPPPALIGPPDLTRECFADVPLPEPSSVLVTGGAGLVTVLHIGDVVQTNGCDILVLRTYEATDSCGSQTLCHQTITVRDTKPPVFTALPGRTVECGLDWNFDAPVVTDDCEGTGVTLAIVGTVTNAFCGNTYTATRTWQATDRCGNNATVSQTITVQDITPPVITCPADRLLNCPADTSVAANGSATATDACDSSVTITSSDETTPGTCAGAFIIKRTWVATDACGNQSQCVQTITVQDITPPAITCVPDRIVECGATWDFDLPTATDTCSGSDVVITVTTTVTNSLPGNLLASTRTWTATDACGNTATCSQTISVADTTAPAIVCATNTIAHCTGPEGAIVSFQVSAADACDTDVQVICVPPSGSVFPMGTTTVQCTATDVNANVGQCSFTVTIIDVEPPSITCPANITVVEAPPGSGHAAIGFATPSSSDNGDLNPVVVCSPPSGSILPVGDTLVRCVATDASANTTACSFQVRVVPHIVLANSTADSGPGSLRQALLDANAAPGSNVVTFGFSGTAPYIIHLLSPLPAITDPVTIDGWSQLEFRGQPVIQLDGSNAISSGFAAASEGLIVAGLDIVAGNSEVRGLALNGFEVGIRISGSGGNIVQGNFIGTDASGSTALGNTSDGIRVHSAGNLIGGDTTAARNVISGNRGNGVVLDGSNAVNNVVHGNLIGPADETLLPLGNGRNGVAVRNGAANNSVGPNNVIAFSQLNGVLLEPSAGNGNAIRGNSIYSNGALGIDLGGDGTTPNDDEDVDSGPNQLQNIPVLTSAQLSGETTIVAGTLNGTSNSVFQIDLFLNATNDPTGFGKGETFLGSITVETDASGHGEFTATLPVTVPANQFITATATDAANNTSEFSLAAQVGGAPVIITNPIGSAVTPGGSLTVCVTAAGSQPLTYQWRLNGANIPDATNTCFTIENAQLTDGGSYTVVVANDLGVVTSDPAVLRLILPRAAIADNFADRVLLGGVNGLVAWNNTNATLEFGEPNHAGKPGGKSIWYKWVAPSTGVATFSAIGSAFDTLLAVYTGGSITNLALVESDEDRGGFFTSIVRFNAVAGTEYQIAIDGFGGASGEFVFSWDFVATTQLLPVISNPPVNQTVVAGSTVTFSVNANVAGGSDDEDDHDDKDDKSPRHRQDKDKEPLTYQWYLNGSAIPGGTQSSLTVTNVQAVNVGIYTVVVTGSNKQFVETQPVSLQINETGPNAQFVQAKDKFLDAANSAPLSLGNPSTLFSASADSGETSITAAAIVRSYTSTQVFSSAGGTTSEGERLLCYGVGGASEWFAVVTEEPGTLFVNTDGSSYDTVMAIYTYAPANAGLIQLGCDNNSGKDGRDSALSVPVQARQTNFVVIDGFNGASGVASLHFSLVTPGSLKPNGFTAQNAFKLRLTGQPAMRFTIQASTNFVNWIPLLTNTSATGSFDYTDPKSTNALRRFYRALMLP